MGRFDLMIKDKYFNKGIIIEFKITKNDVIKAILNINIEQININSYLKKRKKYLPSEDKFGVIDVRIKTKEKEEMNVGIQFIDGIYYIKTKMLLYYSQIHFNQIEYNDNRKIAKTVTINFIENSFSSIPKYKEIIKIKTKKFNNIIKEVEMYLIELSKFRIKEIDKNSKEEDWIAYIKGDTKENIEKIINKNEKIYLLDKKINEFWNNEKME